MLNNFEPPRVMPLMACKTVHYVVWQTPLNGFIECWFVAAVSAASAGAGAGAAAGACYRMSTVPVYTHVTLNFWFVVFVSTASDVDVNILCSLP